MNDTGRAAMIVELTALLHQESRPFSIVIPQNVPVFIEPLISEAGDTVGTKLVISGLGNILCQENYEQVMAMFPRKEKKKGMTLASVLPLKKGDPA
jgi:hypothetical protein